MAKGIPVDLGHVQFRIKGDARAYFSEMLSRYSVGQRVSAEDARDLASLLGRHSAYDAKVGRGIDHFVVMDDGHSYKCFGIMRVDGSIEDFSYKHCIYGK